MPKRRFKTTAMQEVEAALGLPLEAYLAQAVGAGHTWDQIAFDLNVSRLTLRDWLKRLGGRVEVRRTISFPAGADETVSR